MHSEFTAVSVFLNVFPVAQLFIRLRAPSAVMAGTVARRRNYSEGASGERLDHQEEQRL